MCDILCTFFLLHGPPAHGVSSLNCSLLLTALPKTIAPRRRFPTDTARMHSALPFWAFNGRYNALNSTENTSIGQDSEKRILSLSPAMNSREALETPIE